MIIYFDRASEVVAEAIQRGFDQEYLDLKEFLKNRGFQIADLAYSGEDSVIRLSETAALVEIAEVVIAIGDYPSIGFSSIVKEVCRVSVKKVCVLFWKGCLSKGVWNHKALSVPGDIRVWRYDDFEQIAQVLHQISQELDNKAKLKTHSVVG